MTYITGDIHGNPREIIDFCKIHELTEDDVVVILGDVGVNFYLNSRDNSTKKKMSKVKPTFFCIHGNHEARPYNISTYKVKEFHGAPVWYEENYPNILFAKDGEIYDFDGKKCLVIGGAYSVDKYYRFYSHVLNYSVDIDPSVFFSLKHIISPNVIVSKEAKAEIDKCMENFDDNFCWWKDEQPSEEVKDYVEKQIEKNNRKVDIIFSHTCPYKYRPVEMFLGGINRSSVDDSTENWLDKIEETTQYDKWYCGHWHTDKVIDRMVFLFHTVKTLI